MPLAAGEQFASKWDFRELIDHDLIDYARIDLCIAGGFTEALKLAGWCEGHFIDLAVHNPLGPVAAACLHLNLAIPNFGVQEQPSKTGTMLTDVVQDQPAWQDGAMTPNERPGLGLTFDRVAAADHPLSRRRCRACIARMAVLPTGNGGEAVGGTAMDWWAWVLVALAVVLITAGVPWLVYVVVRWLMVRPGPFLAAEGQRRQALVDALARQRAAWPSIPRLGRYREFDQKALDRLADLATTSSDVEQLWPGLASYTGASFGPVEVATLRGWPAMLTALAARRDQRQVQQLLRVGEQQLDEIALLQDMVAEIPSAVTDLVRERAKQAEALVASVAATEAGLRGHGRA